MGRKSIDMTNQVFKTWKVIQKTEPKTKNVSNATWWECECIVCNTRESFDGTQLRINRIRQCSHRKTSCKYLFGTIKDETGKKYGKLTVESFAYTYNSKAYWNCICECGNCSIVSGNSLRTNAVKSCGCVSSYKELEIKKILEDNHIIFEQQYSFKDLKDKGYLRFDFALFDKNNELKGLIEYNGRQHYEPNNRFNHNGQLQKHDLMKTNYCKQHNIPLLVLNRDNDLFNDITNWLSLMEFI